jgi:predicted RNase H-like nuclease (RuvC/YqgF family)
MKKILFLTLCAAMLASCEFQTKREKELTVQNESLVNELSKKNEALENAIQTISNIQEGFRVIDEAEGRVSIQSQGTEGLTDAERLREDVRFIQQKMEENRQQIAQLEKQLKASGADNANLRKMIVGLQRDLEAKVRDIAALRKELEQKNIRIAELDDAIVLLTGDVNTLQKANDEQQEVIERQIEQLNRAWYVYGTAKELKEQNILRGGKVLSAADFNKSYFTEIDIRVDRVFPLYSKQAQLLTVHPTGSYELVKDADKMITLNILDFEAFWSVSRYMVIQVR